MSSNPPPDGASPEPPATSNPLTGAILPVAVVIVLILLGLFAVIPFMKDLSRTEDKIRSMSKPGPITVPYNNQPR